MPRFVLDHNFPAFALEIRWPPSLILEPLKHYDSRLIRDHADWQVITEISRRDDVDGYISNDAKMLNLPTELVAIQQSNLIVIITDGPENDPLAATGLLLTHLDEITRREPDRRGAQLYRLRPRDLGRDGKLRLHIMRLIEELANREYVTRDALVAEAARRIESWPSLPSEPPPDRFPPLEPPRRGPRKRR